MKLYIALFFGMTLNIIGLIIFIMLYNRDVNSNSAILQQYQREHIVAQVCTMYGLAITAVSILLFKKI